MKILYFASLRERLGPEEYFTIDTKTTVKVFFKEHIAGRLQGLSEDNFLFAVNEEMVGGDKEISDSDTLAIMPPLSGGTTEMTRIQTEDFSMEEEFARCADGRKDVGGVATFTGVVRDISQESNILKIEFSHYGPMAEKELAKVRTTAIEKFNIINLTIVHRVGTLLPGDRIVGITAVARHRAPAFEACAFAIDELKKKVPIWKKEFTDKGEVWVESTP